MHRLLGNTWSRQRWQRAAGYSLEGTLALSATRQPFSVIELKKEKARSGDMKNHPVPAVML